MVCAEYLQDTQANLSTLLHTSFQISWVYHWKQPGYTADALGVACW